MKNMSSSRILFTDNALPFLLDIFGKEIDGNGLIIEKSTGEPVLTPDGEEIYQQNFGGLKKGSEIFIKGDLYGIMNLVEGKY